MMVDILPKPRTKVDVRPSKALGFEPHWRLRRRKMERGGNMHEPYGMEDYSDQSPVFSIDPVCGGKVDEALAAGRTGYAGQMYYFCSADCKIRFEEDPGKYIGQRR